MSILDPCAGEGVAIMKPPHAPGREQVQAFAVELRRRAPATHGNWSIIQGDLMDALISRQSFRAAG